MNLFHNSFDKITTRSLSQRFLVLVHVIEGNHYLKPNMNTCVQVQLHHETKMTRVKKATFAPYYNETFVFDFEQTFENFLDNVVTLTVMDTGGTFKVKKPLGVVQFDLSTVWDMEHHQIYHKWAKLTDPKNRMPFIKGYLKFDLHILGPGETLKIPHQMKRADEQLEGNLLFGTEGRNLEAQAKYIVRVYKGKDFLSKADIPLLHQGRLPSPDITNNVSIAVTYARNALSTERKPYRISWHSEITWNDQFIFTELFPPTFQRIKVEVLINKVFTESLDKRLVGWLDAYLLGNLRDIISTVGMIKESIPVFGPSVVYIYTSEMFYSGRLLMAVEAIPVSVSLLKLNVGTAEKSKATGIQQDKLWSEDDFLLFIAVYEMSMLRKELSGNDMSLDDVYYNLNISNDKPCLHFTLTLPDLRKRLYLRNRIFRIQEALKEKLGKVQEKIFSKDEDRAGKVLKEAVTGLVESLSKFEMSCKHLNPDEKLTVKKLRATFQEIRNEVQARLDEQRTLEDKLSKLRSYAKTLDKLTQDLPMSFPYAFIHLLNKNNLVASRKIRPGHIIYSEEEQERGVECGRFNNRNSADTMGGRIDAYMWFGLASQRAACIRMLPVDDDVMKDMLSKEALPHVIPHTRKTLFQTRAHVYNAVIDLGHDVSGLSDPYVKAISGSKSAMSHTVKATVTPIWKETVVISRVVRYRIKSRIQQNQPTIILELWDDDDFKTKSGAKEKLKVISNKLTKDRDELIGRAVVKPNVVLLQDTKSASSTKLRTYPVYNRFMQVGEITAAVELVEIVEDGDENADLTKVEQVVEGDKGALIYKMPQHLLPPEKAYMMEVLFWGLRDVKKIRTPCIALRCADGKAKSSVIRDYRRHQNFEMLSAVVQVNLNKYKTPLVIKLYQKKRGQYVYKGICVQDNINHLFRHFIEEKSWKLHLNQRNVLLHEKALSEARSSRTSEVKINMDLPLGELERLHRATRKYRRKHKCGEKCKKCLKRSGKHAMRTGHYLNAWLKLPERKQNFNICSIPYLVLTLLQILLWTGKKLFLFAMYCVCGYNRTVKIRARYYKLIELEEKPSGSNVYDTFTIPEVDTDEEEKPDWWSLYYSSVYSSGVVEKIQQIQRENEERKTIRLCKCCNIVPPKNELELVPEFEHFADVLQTFDFYYGKLFSNNKNTLAEMKVGSFKGNVMFYPADRDHLVTFSGKPLSNGALQESVDNETVNVTIRVYIVRAYGLHPKDKDGKCDPYIVLKTGSIEINDRENYVTNQINPYFGRHFEIQGSFPTDAKLTVEIKDHDSVSKDDYIGMTEMDLESRFYSLARNYTTEWRDQLRPSQILEELCDRHEIGYPVYFEKSVVVGSRDFELPFRSDGEDFREELALYALRNWHQVPLVGTHLVPQHIESRTLYSPVSQGVSQGVLEMWVDMFATDYGWVPSPVNIELRKPVDYELRVIVWNTADVELMDDAYFTGEKHSDIYVKGWLQGKDDVQQTDVHYRSSQGEGFFNWRFLFEVKYFSAEALMVVIRKDEEYRVPPKLHLQVWDNDNFSQDDYIGTLVLDLSRMPRGARSAARCTGDIVKDTAPTLNLFQTKRCRGWWPFQLGGNGPDKHKVVGKLEAEFHILTKEEAEQSPVGLGRRDPEALPVPVRPDRFNFNFILTPYRVLLDVVKTHKWKFILGGLVLSVVLFGALFVYAFPGYAVKFLLHV
ncbi:hypothetical protein M8J75_014243 [Diaphorina citri]|nr:hypothetical protein M8J75_014243 [Diaphorina citri]